MSAAVHNALSHRKRELEQVEATGIHVRMEARRRAHPTGEPTGMVADKAFYDSLNDEVDD
jgi:antitoxin VapB